MLNSDALLERLHLRRQLGMWRVLCIMVLASLAAIVVRDVGRDGIGTNEPYVAKIRIEGVIIDDPKILKLIRKIGNDNNAKAVLLELDTPGGTVVGGEAIYKEIKKLSKEKPVVALMRGTAASAGYMIAVASNRIYAMEGTITGSIGVLLETAEFSRLAEKIGVKPIVIKSGYHKAVPSATEPLEPRQREVITQVVQDFYLTFVGMVASGRNMKQEQVMALADGRVFTGRQAVEVGLVDAIGGEDEALAWLRKHKGIRRHLKVRKTHLSSPEASLFERMLGSFLGKSMISDRLSLDGLLAIWQPA